MTREEKALALLEAVESGEAYVTYLPMKLGETVYKIYRNMPNGSSHFVDTRRYLKDIAKRYWRYGDRLEAVKGKFTRSDKSKLGVTVFRTREEAEEAIREAEALRDDV